MVFIFFVPCWLFFHLSLNNSIQIKMFVLRKLRVPLTILLRTIHSVYEHVHRQCPTYTLRVPLTILLRSIHSVYEHVHTQCPIYTKFPYVTVYVTSNTRHCALTALLTYLSHLVNCIYICTMSAEMFKMLFISVCQIKYFTKYI